MPENMPFILFIVITVVFVVVLILIFRRRSRQRKLDQDQIDRKAREDALNRAISNHMHKTPPAESHAPLEVHYNSDQKAPKGMRMIRLTELSESVKREYLFRWDETVFLGEEHGRGAVFQYRKNHIVYCKLFPVETKICVTRIGDRNGYLVRGKKQVELGTGSLQVLSGDRIEIASGTFLVELI